VLVIVSVWLLTLKYRSASCLPAIKYIRLYCVNSIEQSGQKSKHLAETELTTFYLLPWKSWEEGVALLCEAEL